MRTDVCPEAAPTEHSTSLLLYFTANCKTVGNQLVPLWRCGGLVHVWPRAHLASRYPTPNTHILLPKLKDPDCIHLRPTVHGKEGRNLQTRFLRQNLTCVHRYWFTRTSTSWRFPTSSQWFRPIKGRRIPQENTATQQQHNFGTDKHIAKCSMLFF